MVRCSGSTKVSRVVIDLFEAAQLDAMHVKGMAAIELVCVSSCEDTDKKRALRTDHVFTDWGLAFGLDHRRTFPDAPAAMTPVSNAQTALEYINSIGGSAYLPRRMIEQDIEFSSLLEVVDAPTFERRTLATEPVHAPRRELVKECLSLIPV